MKVDFRIKALPIYHFNDLFNLGEEQLKAVGGKRMTVDKKPGFPCRLSLKDAEVGEEVILISYEHHNTSSPYRASGPVFVRKGVERAVPEINEIPEMLKHRFLSLRAYDAHGHMRNAITTHGKFVKSKIFLLFEDQNVSYIHVHNANPGCFNCQIERTTTL